MVRTYIYGDQYYSVDMMFAYINLFKPKHQMVELDRIVFDINNKFWRNSKSMISPKMVLGNPKKYQEHFKLIKNADLKYPIILDSKLRIIDGNHRFLRSIIDDKKNIRAYVFDRKMMSKFLLPKNNNQPLSTNKYIELFFKRFTI